MEKFDLVRFTDNDFELDVCTDSENETVWLTQEEMSALFDVSVDNISLHIKNILKEGELDNSVVEESSVTAADGKSYITKLYSLDMVISVGYRIKSKRGIAFRRWANKVLKDYLIKGHAINQKRLDALNKTNRYPEQDACVLFEY